MEGRRRNKGNQLHQGVDENLQYAKLSFIEWVAQKVNFVQPPYLSYSLMNFDSLLETQSYICRICNEYKKFNLDCQIDFLFDLKMGS